MFKGLVEIGFFAIFGTVEARAKLPFFGRFKGPISWDNFNGFALASTVPKIAKKPISTRPLNTRPSCFFIWASHGFHIDMTGICLCMDMDMAIFGICLSIF